MQVARLRSFSRAAEALNVAQSALSRHVQALEAEFGAQLLFRTTRGVELTEAGSILLERGEALLEHAEDIKSAVQVRSDLPSGTVTVGLPPSLAAIFASRIIEECSRIHPDVTVKIIEGLGRFLEEWLRLGKLDVAILTDLGDTEAFRIARIAREEMVLVAAPSTWPHGPTTLTLAEAAALDLTITHGFRTVVDRLILPTGLVMHYAEEFDSIPLILDRILSYPLVTILPHGFVRNDEIAGKLKVCRIVEPRLTRDLLLASNPRRAHTAAMQAVGNVIRARIADVLVH